MSLLLLKTSNRLSQTHNFASGYLLLIFFEKQITDGGYALMNDGQWYDWFNVIWFVLRHFLWLFSNTILRRSTESFDYQEEPFAKQLAVGCFYRLYRKSNLFIKSFQARTFPSRRQPESWDHFEALTTRPVLALNWRSEPETQAHLDQDQTQPWRYWYHKDFPLGNHPSPIS